MGCADVKSEHRTPVIDRDPVHAPIVLQSSPDQKKQQPHQQGFSGISAAVASELQEQLVQRQNQRGEKKIVAQWAEQSLRILNDDVRIIEREDTARDGKPHGQVKIEFQDYRHGGVR